VYQFWLRLDFECRIRREIGDDLARFPLHEDWSGGLMEPYMAKTPNSNIQLQRNPKHQSPTARMMKERELSGEMNADS